MYTLYLNDEFLGCGSVADLTVLVAEASTQLLTRDLLCAYDVATVHEAFRSGAVAEGLEAYGQWTYRMKVLDKAVTLHIKSGR